MSLFFSHICVYSYRSVDSIRSPVNARQCAAEDRNIHDRVYDYLQIGRIMSTQYQRKPVDCGGGGRCWANACAPQLGVSVAEIIRQVVACMLANRTWVAKHLV